MVRNNGEYHVPQLPIKNRGPLHHIPASSMSGLEHFPEKGKLFWNKITPLWAPVTRMVTFSFCWAEVCLPWLTLAQMCPKSISNAISNTLPITSVHREAGPGEQLKQMCMQNPGGGKIGTEGGQKESRSGDEPGWPEEEQAWHIWGGCKETSPPSSGVFLAQDFSKICHSQPSNKCVLCICQAVKE